MGVTLKDVARRAGVSYATVSRVLAGKPNIREETITKVKEAADALGYKPNRTARYLQAQRSKIIGVIVSDIQYDFFPPVVRAIEDYATVAGYSVILCNSDERLDKERRYVDLLLEENVAGAVIAPTGQESGHIQMLVDADIPVVLVDRVVKGLEVDSVEVDNFAAAYRAASHLVESGFERIGAIVGSRHASTANDRYEGYVRALQDRGLEATPELCITGAPHVEVGYDAMKELLLSSAPPDAVFISNHLLAAGAFQAIREQDTGRVQSLGLVTFDDPPWALFVTPAVTAVAQPQYEIGERGVQLLLDRIENPTQPVRHVVLDTTLKVRDSSRMWDAGSERPMRPEGGSMG